MFVVPVGVRAFEMRVESRRDDEPDIDHLTEQRERVESTGGRPFVVDVLPCRPVETDDDRRYLIASVEQRNECFVEHVEASRQSWIVARADLEYLVASVAVPLLLSFT